MRGPVFKVAVYGNAALVHGVVRDCAGAGVLQVDAVDVVRRVCVVGDCAVAGVLEADALFVVLACVVGDCAGAGGVKVDANAVVVVR